MRLFEELNDDNFTMYAAKNYNNPQCQDIEEFYEDLQRFKYLKRLLKRYHHQDDLQERLILNHLVVLYNLFGIQAANKMMFFKVEVEYWSTIKTFLVFLNYIREDHKVEVPLDETVVEKLRKL